MVDKHIIELINREIDNELTVQEKNRLDDYLQTNLEAKALYEELKNLATNLDSQAEIEPPDDLKLNIISMGSNRR